MIDHWMNGAIAGRDERDVNLAIDRRSLLAAGLTIGALSVGEASAQAVPPAAVGASGPGRLTCHVLDTYSGRPAEGMKVELSTRDGAAWKLVRSAMTVGTGRTAEPLMTGEAMLTGDFMLEFFHADYFGRRAFLPNPPFYDRIVHFFAVPAKETKYHITMVAAPWGYSTFRWKE
jgi:5-hydroxyisourate hydrolase